MAKVNKSFEYNDAFPLRFRNLSEKSSYTMEEMAQAFSTTRQTVRNWQTGETVPDVISICCIAKFFGVTTDYLLGLTDTPTLNTDIREISDYTGLWGGAIAQLHIEKSSDLQEGLAEFLSYLATHKETTKLVQAIKNRNTFIDSSQKGWIDCGVSGAYEMPMDSLMKAVVDDIFWKILEDYTVKPDEVLTEWRVNNGSNNKTNET